VFGQGSPLLSLQMSHSLGEFHKDTRDMRQGARRVKRAGGEPDEGERALRSFMSPLSETANEQISVARTTASRYPWKCKGYYRGARRILSPPDKRR
jgi:hypothetical protein